MLPGCQRKKRKGKRTHGFLRRQSGKGFLVIKRRRRKKRKRLSV